MSNKSLIIGDLHIGKGLSIGKAATDSSLNSRLTDQINILNWVLNIGINKEVSRFIITGDVFEEIKPDSNYVVIFMDWLKHCQEYGIDVHIIMGNHDQKRVGDRYTSILNIIQTANIENVSIYNKIYTLHTEGVSFTLVPFRDRRSLNCNTIDEALLKISNWIPFELSDIPINNCKVLIGHLAIEKSFWTDEIDDLTNEIMVPLSLFDGFDYVWMGHVHKPQVFNKKNPYIAHIGSMDLTDFGETEQEKIVILFDPNLKNKFEKIVIPTRPLRRIRLEIPKGENATDFLINKINEIKSFKNAIVKLEITILDHETLDIDRDKVIRRLYELGAYHICNFSESRTIMVVSDDKKHISDSAIEPKAAIKLYADVLDIEDDDKACFITACNEIIDTVEG